MKSNRKLFIAGNHAGFSLAVVDIFIIYVIIKTAMTIRSLLVVRGARRSASLQLLRYCRNIRTASQID